MKKQASTSNSNQVTVYMDGFQYYNKNSNDADNSLKLQFFPTAEGYVKAIYDARGTNTYPRFKYVYNYTDHLGNIRLSYTLQNLSTIKILEENHYYPFGLKHQNYNATKKELYVKGIPTAPIATKTVPDRSYTNLISKYDIFIKKCSR